LPEKHPKITDQERKLILEDSKNSETAQKASRSFSILKLLKKKESWGCFSARIFIDPVVYFLIFWIPKYLQDVHGFTLSEIGMTAWLPYAAMGIGTILGGWLPKFLIERKNWSLNRSRKTIMFLASIAIPVFCLFLSVKVSPVVAILLISAIMMFHGLWSNITLPTEIYPSNIQATITGIGSTLGGLTSVISQKLIGISVGNHSYLPIFMFVGLAYLTSFILVQLLIGQLGTIRNN
jgi:ACS family hexuronate transporter-like MFS transporter